jgi:DNA-directed RNA polymerase subunit RPC12/RpoP
VIILNSVDYKCPNCNAVLKYNPKGKNWKCEYCGSSFNKEELDLNEEKFEKNKVKKPKENNVEGVEVDEYTCQNCGAKIVADVNTAATFCVYCRNTAILKSRLTDKFAPNRVIPFAKTKQDAIEGFKSVCKGKIFAPKEFALERNINEITGVYIPFWLHSCDMNAVMNGKGTRITTWTVGDQRYTKTDIFEVDREGNYTFESIPVDGSKRFDDAIMNSIEPFDYGELKDFAAGYLSGFLAEKYDIEKDEAKKITLKRAQNSATTNIRNTIPYTSFTAEKSEANITSENIEYVLLPVWMVNVKYNGKMYPFAMNGQTGKMIGNIPWSGAKAFLAFVIVFIITFIIAMIFTYIIS